MTSFPTFPHRRSSAATANRLFTNKRLRASCVQQKIIYPPQHFLSLALCLFRVKQKRSLLEMHNPRMNLISSNCLLIIDLLSFSHSFLTFFFFCLHVSEIPAKLATYIICNTMNHVCREKECVPITWACALPLADGRIFPREPDMNICNVLCRSIKKAKS